MLATDHLDRAAAHHPDRAAIVAGDVRISYRDAVRHSFEIANALLASGVRPGTHVAILAPNHPLVLVCQYGIMRAGCVWIPANHRNTPADTMLQFKRLDVEFVFFHSSTSSHLDDVAAQVDRLAGAIPIDQAVRCTPSVLDWAASFPMREPPAERDVDDPLIVAATGGTSGGGLKGAVHTHRTLEMNIATYYALHHFRKPVVHLVVAPLTHSAAIVHWGLVGLAATNVICPSADPAEVLAMIERHRVTILFLPPTILYMLLAHPDLGRYDLSSLEYVALGSAPISVDKLKEAIAVFGSVLCQPYGSTETLNIKTYLTREDVAEACDNPALQHRLSSVGREAPFSRVEIMDDNGALLPAGERGEIVMRGGSIMIGYYKDPDLTRAGRAHGWHHTGDIGFKDEDGYVYLVDRKNDLIITGGFNVYPAEVEQVALLHPAVRDCAVVGVPHEKWGEIVLAAVELKDGASLDVEGFIGFCRQRLGGVRTPKVVEVVPELPRSPVGKVLRRAVRDYYGSGSDSTS